MRTGRTLTVFRKLENPPPPGPDPPPENLEQTPPHENLEQTPPQKFGADTPLKIWSRHPPTPPVDRMTHASENITLAKNFVFGR